MKGNRFIKVYTAIWMGAMAIMVIFLLRMYGDASIINYAGLVRGATQMSVKTELYGVSNDELIMYIDDIIYDLETGRGNFELIKYSEAGFQGQLDEVILVWEEMKTEIYLYRAGETDGEHLYELSVAHFVQADAMVSIVETASKNRLIEFILFFCVSLFVGVVFVFYKYRENKKELIEKENTDSLTGLMNKTGLEKEISRILEENPTEQFAVVEFDINQFKMINYKHGYKVGDELLCGIAKELKELEGDACACARIYADDFVIITKSSCSLIARLEYALYNPVQQLGFHRYFDTVRFVFGGYEIVDNTESPKSILDKANIAHKFVKERSLDYLAWYDEKLLVDLKKAQFYVERIQEAVENREFQVYLQPQIDLKTMKMISAESLVRWKLPDGTLVFPDEFIPLFERTGLISKVDFYMLEKVCSYIRDTIVLHEAFSVAVNFSRVTLYHEEFQEQFLRIVDRYKIPYSSIELEITESALNNLDTPIIQILTELREKGFRLAMDDFGAGYSSLSFLSKLPVHVLKLDRQFLWGIDDDENMKEIIKSTVVMAQKIGLEVICEGVEKESHLEFLHEIGCDYAQGYYFSKPVPKDELTF
ncbi:MAG: EAL domain-containing protein [Lachnospiraceae bacterium]